MTLEDLKKEYSYEVLSGLIDNMEVHSLEAPDSCSTEYMFVLGGCHYLCIIRDEWTIDFILHELVCAAEQTLIGCCQMYKEIPF